MTRAGDQLFEELMRFKPDGLSPNAWAVRAGVSRTVWTDLRRHGNPSRRTLEKLLAAAGSSLAEFEALRVGDAPSPPGIKSAPLAETGRPWRMAPLAPLPLIASAAGGSRSVADQQSELMRIAPGEVVDRLARPPSLAAEPNAYAVTIAGDSMWPRFRRGRRIVVAPDATIVAGDDILVQLAELDADGWTPVVIGELVRRNASEIELRQFNPPVTFTVAAGEFVATHKVAGELI